MEVTKLPGYQIAITKQGSVNPPLSVVLAGYQMVTNLYWKMHRDYQVTRLPDITEQEICKIHL